jgi:hypothetical protein
MAATPEERIKIEELRIEQVKQKQIEREIAQRNLNLKIQLKEMRSKEQLIRQQNQLGSLFSKQSINYRLATMSPATSMFLKQMANSVEKTLEDRTRALAFGRTQLDLLKGGKREKFEGGIGGFLAQAEANLQGLEAGITDLPDSLRDLGVAMMLTGQDSKKLMASMRKSAVVGGLTNEELASLGTAVAESADTYGTKAETIVNALDGVSQELLKFNLLDTAGSFQEAIAQVAGKLGEGSEELLSRFVSQVAGRDNLDNQIRLGIQTLVSDMMKSTDANEQAKLLEEIIRKSGDQTKSLTNRLTTGANLTQNALGISEDMFGEIGLVGNALNDMNKRQARDESDRRKANDQFQAQMNESMSRIQGAMYSGGGSVAEILSHNTNILIGIGAAITALNAIMAAGQAKDLIKGGFEKYKNILTDLTTLRKVESAAKTAEVGKSAAEAAESIKDVADSAGKTGGFRGSGLIKGGGVLLLGTVLASKLYDMWDESNKKEEQRLKDIESSMSQNKDAANANRARQIEKNLNYDRRRNQLQQVREQMRFKNENSPLESVGNAKDLGVSTKNVAPVGNLSDIKVKNSGNAELVTYTSTSNRTDAENEDLYLRAKSKGIVDFSKSRRGTSVSEEEEMFKGRAWAEQQEMNEHLKQIAESSTKTSKNTAPQPQKPSVATGIRRSE